MFYIINLLKILSQSPIKGMVWVILSCLLVGISGHKNLIDKKIFNSFQTKIADSSLQALISDKENHSWLSRKISILPGVHKVEILSKDKIKQKAEKIMGQFQINSTEEKLEMGFVGIKIFFKSGLSINSQNLIREYLIRLVGKSNITIGGTKSIPHKLSSKSTLRLSNILETHGTNIILLILFLAWIISSSIFIKAVRDISHLIEQFQRKKFVGIKTIFGGIILIMALTIIATFPFAPPEWFNLGVIAILFLSTYGILLSRKYSWNG